MKFEIDINGLRSEILNRKGVKSFEMMAKEIGVSHHAVSDLTLTDNSRYNNLNGYIHICAWLGVSLYKFIKIEGAEETIGTAEKHNELIK